MTNALMSVKGLARLLYEMGRTFDGLNTTRMATEDFLRTGNPNVLGSKNDLALLEDLRDAAEFTLVHAATAPFDMTFVCAINRTLSRTAAIQPGALRTSENIIVRCSGGRVYTPQVPQKEELEGMMADAEDSQGSLHDAARLFVQLAKAQPFGDGNKRTALLAGNALLLRKGSEAVLSVPVDQPHTDEFNRLLSDWYLGGSDDVIGWLADWNSARDAA
ncbi:MAG: Fic family protein [Bifidobacteriaceae bacterium]|nr:Fic family protein [Bifidobacteriaceae bacterium]